MPLEKAETVFQSYLKKRNLKLTPERLTVLREVFQHHEHLDADALQYRLRSKDSKVSRATIYRTLELLVDSGLIRKESLGGSTAHYEHSYGARHHDHLICLSCKQIIEFVNDKIEALQDKVCRDHGFAAVRHSMQIFGYCSKCGIPS